MICTCGREVRLRVMRISVNRKRGVTHWLEHMDGTKPCIDGDWSCAALKPYPKNDEDSEWRKLVRRFESASAPDKEADRE